MRGVHIAGSDDELAACVADVEDVLDPAVHLPAWPFRAARGEVRLMQYSRLMGGAVVPVLDALMASHRDESLTLVTFEPTASYYIASCAN